MARWPASRSATVPGSRSPPAKACRSSIPRRPRSRARSAWPAVPTGWPWSPASTTRRLYVTNGPPDDPGYDVIAVGGDSAKDGPVSTGRHPLPAPGTWVAYNEATQMVHILGRVAPGSTGAPDDGWTVYVVEPHANAVYADARLPDGMTPAAWAMDVEPEYMTADRQELLVFGGRRDDRVDRGRLARLRVAAAGGHRRRAHGRLPLPAGPDPVPAPARGRARRRVRAARRHALRPVADRHERRLRRPVHHRRVRDLRGRLDGLVALAASGAFWMAMPVIGVLLGLALASSGSPPTRSGRSLLLLLVRSALGRVVSILGLIGITSVLGYMAIAVPEGRRHRQRDVPAGHDRPDPGRRRRRGHASRSPGPTRSSGSPCSRRPPWARSCSSASLALGSARTRPSPLGSVAVTPAPDRVPAGARLDSSSTRPSGSAGGIGYGPLATPPGPADPARLLEPPATRPIGWLRPGRRLGCRWSGRRSRCSCRSRSSSMSCRYIPWALHREPPALAGLSRRAHRPDAGRPDPPDVRLPQRPDVAAPGVVAVVGVAVRPQAGVVLPGLVRGRDDGGHLRRRQPRHLVARRRRP